MQQPVVDRTRFDQLFDVNFGAAQETFNILPDEALPMRVMIVTQEPDGTWLPHMLMLAHVGQERFYLMAGIGVQFATERKDVVAVYVTTEGYGIAIPHGEERPAGHIKDMAGRDELLIVMGVTRDQHNRIERRRIVRENGKRVALAVVPDYADMKVRSDLINAFYKGYERTLDTMIARTN